ncbi:hypothetical protein STCU_07301 [Strigomonas culicis]|uniref:Uncharacterized protein n=1 Tax=Strigomonas culicis TaxID=28005 RepID=S9VB01_9TRYP|nr:hypothetical protein STCU_07301 [Strigomonas culicis]|eukprot:EPY24196.1 hypothetical protein STCU_07301 [Strigomonas culicis]
MQLSAVCDAISSITNETAHAEIESIALQSEAHLGHVAEILDAVSNTLALSSGAQRLALWFLVDRLAKQHTVFLDALRSKLISMATKYAPLPDSNEWDDFISLLKTSVSVLFGAPMVSLILMQLKVDGTAPQGVERVAPSPASSSALAVRSTALRSAGAFVTKAIKVERTASQKHRLQVKTIDSQMSMAVASSYAPVKPVEIAVPELRKDADAPEGYMQALPSDYAKKYEDARRKRLREVMDKNREEQDRRQEQQLLNSIRNTKAELAESSVTAARSDAPDFSDIIMPLELPRDEFGVKRGNFPLGVRFLRNAIAACGGAVELDVLITRLSTLASREVVAEFGDVRQFISIHTPTFRLRVEKDVWVVRLTGDRNESDDTTWERMTCPHCSKVVRGRNFARHEHCRKCITAQIALGLQGNYQGRGPVAVLAFWSNVLIKELEKHHTRRLNAFHLECFAESIEESGKIQRFRLASTKQFAPMLKALRLIREAWLANKGVTEMKDAVVTEQDDSVAYVFRTVGRNVHRLPIAWIEMGDIIDMCGRFSDKVYPAFNPPPRPADPRISLYNEYPGFLLCESEVDSEDEPSGEDDEFSDDEAPAFTFAPPVDTAETLFTAGFERDTKRLQHRMRTAPPMVLRRILKTDGAQSQKAAYADMYGNASTNAPATTERKVGL